VVAGNSTSSYNEVYTGINKTSIAHEIVQRLINTFAGNGASCGDYCIISSGKSNDDDNSLHIDSIIIVAIVPIGVIVCMVIMFYFANRSIDDKFAADPAIVGYADEEENMDEDEFFNDEDNAPKARKLSQDVNQESKHS
jgi:hypothetical protein